MQIRGIQHDSRAVRPGDVFVCAQGGQYDGHLFIDDAIERGAVIILAQLQIPGAPFADRYNWEDDPEGKDFNTSDFYACAERDTAVMEAACEELNKMIHRVDAFAESVELEESAQKTLVAAQGTRMLESAAGFNLLTESAVGAVKRVCFETVDTHDYSCV